MKLTKEEIDERIEQTVSMIRQRLTQAEGEERIEALISDIIDSIVPEKYDVLTKMYLTPEGFKSETSEHANGFNEAIDTIRQNKKELGI